MKKLAILCILAMLCAMCMTGCTGPADSSSPESDAGEASASSSDADNSSSASSTTATTTTTTTTSTTTGGEPEKIPVTPITKSDFLRADGQVLRNEKGEVVILQGTNLGGWLHLEGWMDGGGGDYNDYKCRTTLINKFGEEQTEELLALYQDAFIQESDFEFLQSLGLNYVRIPFFWMELMDNEGNMKDDAFKNLDWAVEICRKLGIYIILDLHGSPGGHSAGWLTGGHTNSNQLWTNTTYQEWTVKIWEALATHYKDDPVIAGYGLLNEPVLPNSGAKITIPQMYDKLYRAVRAIDPDHLIVMGAFYNFDTLGSPAKNGWTNVMYETHHYDDSNKTPANQMNFVNSQLSYIKSYKENWNVPVLAGEFNFWSASDAWRSWLHTLNSMQVSWSTWTYKNTEKNASNCWGLFHQPKVTNINYATDDYDTVAAKWKKYTTSNYRENTFLTTILRECAGQSADMTEGTRLDRSGWTVTAYRTNSGDDPANIIDDDTSSRWANGEAQLPNGEQWIQIDLGKECSFNHIDMFTPNTDAPRGYEIHVSADGENWTKIAEGEGQLGTTAATFKTVSTRYLRVYQTGSANANYWSIHELYLLNV